jgi:cation:H+ antiporter
MSLAASLNVFLAFDGRISRTDGVILILTYCIYLYTLVSHKHSFSIPAHTNFFARKTILNLLILVFSLVAAGIAAYFVNVVSREIYISSTFSLFFIGMIMVAPLGAIPELLFEIELNRQGKSTLALGELFTSLVTNTTLIIGITALVNPIAITANMVYYFGALFFVVLLAIFNYFVHSRNELDWKEGVLLIVCFLVFMVSSMALMFP